MNFLTKGILTGAILMAPTVLVHNQLVYANSQSVIAEHQTKQTSSDLDISQGWTNIDYESDIQPDVSKVFLQGQDILGNQKGVLVQAANLGDSNFKAQKVIPMKKGHKYDLDFIYGQHYNGQGEGFIDFNGNKKIATNDSKDQHYKKTVIPSKDMNYVITASFTTVYPGNAYFKVAYDKSTGGIVDTPTILEAPIITSAPEAGTTKVSGTAYKGNTVEVSDDKGKIGSATVSEDGSFQVTTNRALKYKETLKVVQKNGNATSPNTTVEVVDTKDPESPVLNKITDEDKVVSGTTEPYAAVDVTFEDSELPAPQTYSGTADGNGKFTIPLEQTYLGKTKVIAKAIDEAGHESSETSDEVEFAKKLGLTLNHHISSADTIISGKTTRPNCELEVHFGSRLYTGNSDDKGNFKIIIDKHTPATTYFVKAVDSREPENPATAADIVLPRIPNFTSVKSGMKTLEGIVDPKGEVTLTLTRGKEHFDFKTTADDQGKFAISLKDNEGKDLPLKVGDQLTFQSKLVVDGKDLLSEKGTSTIYTF